ncbi:MAG: HAMP domain-containing sensor histidine kinase [Elusimicrobiales bacterium]|nr:HAMP domain-containing sensor histidine kinase [Elusimicrobiales bacterium]
MITLKDWTKKNVQRPLARLLLLSVCCGAAYLGHISYNRYSEQYDRIGRVRDSISLGVQQSNRPLIEAAMMSVLDGETVVGVALCSGRSALIAYPPESSAYCSSPGRWAFSWVFRKQLVGLQNYEFLAAFSILSLLKPLALLVLAAGLLMAVALYSFARMRERFRAEVLLPLSEGLANTEALSVAELEDLRQKNLDRMRLVSEQASAAALLQLSAQVAHDIRSPLAALGAAARGLALSPDQRTLIDGAVGRMQGIADDLLHRYRAPGAEPKSRVETCALAPLVEQVVAEKRLLHKDRTGLKIDFLNSSAAAKAALDPKELQRIVSNLLNNSVEALAGAGSVAVRLAAEDGRVLLTVADDGKGIPPEVLARLGRKGETHGKAGGTGLGLYHARTSVESWGGGLRIESSPGKGTAVTIDLPAAAKPAPGLRAVLLDDDQLVHMNWRMAAKAAGAELTSCRTPEEFASAVAALPRDIPVFIDSELGGAVRGEDLAVNLHDNGYTDISLATGHAPEKFSHLPWLKVTGKEPPWA